MVVVVVIGLPLINSIISKFVHLHEHIKHVCVTRFKQTNTLRCCMSLAWSKSTIKNLLIFIGSGVIRLRANLYIQDLRAGLIRWKRVADLGVKVFLGRRLAPPPMSWSIWKFPPVRCVQPPDWFNIPAFSLCVKRKVPAREELWRKRPLTVIYTSTEYMKYNHVFFQTSV